MPRLAMRTRPVQRLCSMEVHEKEVAVEENEVEAITVMKELAKQANHVRPSRECKLPEITR